MKLLSDPEKKTFQPKSRSERSNNSIAFFLVVAVLQLGTDLLDSPMTILVAGDRDFQWVRSWKARFEGEKKQKPKECLPTLSGHSDGQRRKGWVKPIVGPNLLLWHGV